MPKRPSGRGIKLHRSYSVDEAARTMRIAKGTVLRWIKSGALPAMTDRRPFLILGSEVNDFLAKQKANRAKCRLHEAYCFTCRAIREPAHSMADFKATSTKTGMMEALCGICSGLMFKRVSRSRIPELQAKLDLTIRQAPSPIGEHS